MNISAIFFRKILIGQRDPRVYGDLKIVRKEAKMSANQKGRQKDFSLLDMC